MLGEWPLCFEVAMDSMYGFEEMWEMIWAVIVELANG